MGQWGTNRKVILGDGAGDVVGLDDVGDAMAARDRMRETGKKPRDLTT
jgi:hypothetical protein